jgi:hypothetical protein
MPVNSNSFMPVNSKNSVESGIIQVGEKLRNSELANLHAMFQVAYITVSMVYCEKAWKAFYRIIT